MSRVLVVGAGGFIGIPLCEELVARGHKVTAVDRYFFGKMPKGCQIVVDDIRSVTVANVDAVIDVCGLSNDASSEIDVDLTRDINFYGARRLAILARDAGVKRYIYASSAAVYGHGTKMGLVETDLCRPLTLYAECKVRVEDYLREISDTSFQPIILRNATVFGVAPRMRFDLAVNGMALRAYRNHEIYVMGGGDQWRPFIHVKDVVQVFAGMLEADTIAGNTFNVGYDALNLRVSELSQMVYRALPFSKIHKIPDGDDQRSYHLNFGKLAVALPKVGMRWTDIPHGIEEIRSALSLNPDLATDPTTMTVAWYKEILAWEKRLDGLRLNGRVL